MTKFALRSLSNRELTMRLNDAMSRDRSTTVELLELLGEHDARKLFREAGYRSMYEYCLGEHHMSEDVACNRLRSARAARRWPVILDMLEDGRLHVSGLGQLSKYLTRENAEELLQAAAHRTRRQIAELLAARFPRPDVPTVLVPMVTLPAPGVVGVFAPASEARPGAHGAVLDLTNGAPSFATEPAAPALAPNPPVPGRVGSMASPIPASAMGPLPERATCTPLSADGYALQATITTRTHAKLRHAQDLLGPAVAPGDFDALLERALDALIAEVEKRKFARTERPRERRTEPASACTIPARVRREVWQRDGGQCAFVSASGHRCECRDGLHFDHIQPVAKGGDARSASNVRLLCGTHNRFEAERILGEGFVRAKVEAARTARRRRASQSAAPGTLDARDADALHEARAECPSKARIHAALRRAHSRGESPADALGSRAAATARAALDRMLTSAG